MLMKLVDTWEKHQVFLTAKPNLMSDLREGNLNVPVVEEPAELSRCKRI